MAVPGANRRIKASQRKKFLEVYADQKCNASQTRQILGLGLHTFDRWMKRYPKFAATIIEIEEAMVDRIEVVLASNAEAGKQRAIEFFLLNRRRKKYRNTQRSEIGGIDGGPITYKEEVYEPVKKIPPIPSKEKTTEEETPIEEKEEG